MNELLLKCEKCGHEFAKSPWWSRILGQVIFVDPAPSPLSFFKKERCPKCGSSKLKKI